MPRRHLLWLAAAFGVIAALAYGQAVGFPFVRWDDGLLITEQPAVRAIAPWSLQWIFTHYDPELYIPLTFFTYQIDWQIGGGAAWPFHLGNIILHTLNAFLAALVSVRLLKRRWAGIGVGLLFLLHPLHVEAVAWASARKDVLSTLFFFLSLLGYLRWKDGDGRLWYRASIATFAVGLLAKVSIAPLPVLLLLIDWRAGRRILTRSQIMEKWPYFAIALVFGLIAIGGKTRLVVATTLAQKLLMACVSTAFYIKHIVWPLHFSLLYPFTDDVALSTPLVLWSVVAVAVGVVVMGGAWIISRRRSRRTSHQEDEWNGMATDIVAWSAWYVVTLAPTWLNFAKGGDMDVYFASDRYAYIPSLGIFLLVGSLLMALVRRYPAGKNGIIAAGCIVLAALGWTSHQQLQTWRSTETLFRNVIEEYPDASHVAHNNLGNAYRLQRNLDRAIEEYNAAIAIREHPKTLSNLGAALRQQGKIDEALATYRRALDIAPESGDAHFGLGIVLAQQRRFAEAEARYREAMRLSPDVEQIPTNLGALFADQGRWEDAVGAYETALHVNPYYPDARFNLAVALEELGRLEEARTAYEDVIRLTPTSISARINFGILLARLGDRDASAQQFRTILRMSPNNATAKEALRQLGE